MDQLQRLRNNSSHPDAAHHLSSLLRSHDGPLPIQQLLLCFQDIWKAAPEPLKANNKGRSSSIIHRLRAQVKAAAPSVAELIRCDGRPGIVDVQRSDRYLSHAAIRQFVQEFWLDLPPRSSRDGKKPRVVVILPNGPLLALAVLAVANAYTVVPMASNAAPEQLLVDIEQVQADAVLGLEADINRLSLDGSRPVFIVQPHEDLTFSLVAAHLQSGCHARAAQTSNTEDDVAIILFTSGTSGTKKLVPITTYNLIAGTMFTIESLGLTGTDCCLNIMPLNHM
jgi:non-ribosomal peptide synthetase component E (peptide arylation enzyme)